LSEDISPPAGTTVHFYAASATVRKAEVKKNPVSHASSRHGAQVVKLENGLLKIEQAWYDADARVE